MNFGRQDRWWTVISLQRAPCKLVRFQSFHTDFRLCVHSTARYSSVNAGLSASAAAKCSAPTLSLAFGVSVSLFRHCQQTLFPSSIPARYGAFNLLLHPRRAPSSTLSTSTDDLRFRVRFSNFCLSSFSGIVSVFLQHQGIESPSPSPCPHPSLTRLPLSRCRPYFDHLLNILVGTQPPSPTTPTSFSSVGSTPPHRQTYTLCQSRHIHLHFFLSR